MIIDYFCENTYIVIIDNLFKHNKNNLYNYLLNYYTDTTNFKYIEDILDKCFKKNIKIYKNKIIELTKKLYNTDNSNDIVRNINNILNDIKIKNVDVDNTI